MCYWWRCCAVTDVSTSPTHPGHSPSPTYIPSGSTTGHEGTPLPDRPNPSAGLLKPSVVIRRGPRGYGFTLRAIRVYYGDSEYYTLHHLVVVRSLMLIVWCSVHSVCVDVRKRYTRYCLDNEVHFVGELIPFVAVWALGCWTQLSLHATDSTQMARSVPVCLSQ